MADHVMVRGERHVIMQCGTCGVWHTFPAARYETAYDEGGFWSCPNGHQRGWAKGADAEEMAQLRRERDRLKQNAAQLEDDIRLERERVAAAEKKYQRASRRAAAGVCPCCNRTFFNVQRHMLSKHKNVVPIEQKSGKTHALQAAERG